MKRNFLTRDQLVEDLSYDSDTGKFNRVRRTSNRIRVGDEAGGIHSTGYRVIRVRGVAYLAHRLAWLYVHGEWPKELVDHINGERSDNRICNLRAATPQQNLQNLGSKGGLIGTSKHNATGKWQAYIRGPNRKLVYLGCYEYRSEAHDAYLQAKKEAHSFQPTPRDSTYKGQSCAI